MQTAVEILAALSFFIVGLSHVAQPRAWAKFFIRLRHKGTVGILQLGLLQLPFALLVVSFHNVWHGLPLLVTLIGWSQLLKGVLYLTVPRLGLKMLGHISLEKAGRFVWAGLFSICLAALIAWSVASKV
jgi:hypothetical protein